MSETPEKKTKRPRVVVDRTYVVQSPLQSAGDWHDIDGQPSHEDTAAAKKWLRKVIENKSLAEGRYRVAAICWVGSGGVKVKSVATLE